MDARDYHDVQAARDERGARVLRAAARAVRLRGGRGRRQPGRDQSARARHRQHGLRRSGGLPGDAHRRHRPRRRASRIWSARWSCLSESEQARVDGLRHQPLPRRPRSAASPDCDWLEERTGKPVLGVLPYLHGLHARRRGRDRSAQCRPERRCAMLQVIVPVLPRISNHTDFDPLRLHPQVDFRFVGPGAADSARRSDRAARQQERARRSRLAARATAGKRRLRAICATAAS